MRIACAALGIVGALVAAASADPPSLAAEVTAHSDAAVARLRKNRTDPPTRCALGAAYALRGDLGHADLYLSGCEDVALAPDLSLAVARARHGLHEKLVDSDLAELHVATEPEGLPVRVAAFTDDVLPSPVTLWLPAQTYDVEIAGTEPWHAAGMTSDGPATETRTVTPEPRKRTTVFVDMRAHTTSAPADQPQHADFSSETATEAPATGAPPDVKHPPITAAKWRGIAEVPSGPQLEDPLAADRAIPHRRRHYAIGVRIGAGMFDDGDARATDGIDLAAVGRVRMRRGNPWWFLAFRADWSRRGGDAAMASSRIDALGFAVGPSVDLYAGGTIGLAALAQLRGDVRLSDARGDAGVHRLGAGLAAGLELTIPHSPLAFGVRFEQGLTPLVPGAYDRALLGEVGVDWR
ncbi:MAG TPA: hypothetical protein VGM88_19185 [Kofleriaceae bacterium]